DKDEQCEQYGPPTPEFCQDDDFYSMVYLSSSSSSFVDDRLLHNESEKVNIISITSTGLFLCIDHHPRFHSFVNNLYLFHTNYWSFTIY
ncbi:unnamed protein product, partial [Rotaria sp. Silwood1]